MYPLNIKEKITRKVFLPPEIQLSKTISSLLPRSKALQSSTNKQRQNEICRSNKILLKKMLEIESNPSFFNKIQRKSSLAPLNCSNKILKLQKIQKSIDCENFIIKKRLEKVKPFYARNSFKKHQKLSEFLQKISSKKHISPSETLKKQEEELQHVEQMLKEELKRQKMLQNPYIRNY